MDNIECIQWLVLILFGLGFLFLAPLSKNSKEFFRAATKKGLKPNTFLLTSSLVISWIFAKSITVAADLGLSYGIVGGAAYATYYLSFLVAGVIIYRMRTIGKFNSIHSFLRTRFGRSAVVIFSVLIAFRLFNEVWSNTMVIGSYFGEYGSSGYFTSVLVFTVLTLAYTLKGGLRSSILTDAVQMLFFTVLLVVILCYIFPSGNESLSEYAQSGEWSVGTGLNLMIVALLQIFSYPFHDSVMTDRGFISDPKTTLKSFIYASFIGVFFLIIFSFVGVFAGFQDLDKPATVSVSKLLGSGMMLVMNFIMITSAASTLDSAFSSFSKLGVIDLKIKTENPLKTGRIIMIVIAIAGTVPIFFNPEILSATTISGTMVMGLAPVFVFWRIKSSKWSFILSTSTGILIGIILATDLFPEFLVLNEGPYNKLLSANVFGIGLCFIAFFIPIIVSKLRSDRF